MNQYIKMLVEDIHSVIVATVDEKGHPVTRAIDLMLEDGNTFYFLTLKIKIYFSPILAHPDLSKKIVVLRVKMDGIDFHPVCQCLQNKQ